MMPSEQEGHFLELERGAVAGDLADSSVTRRHDVRQAGRVGYVADANAVSMGHGGNEPPGLFAGEFRAWRMHRG